MPSELPAWKQLASRTLTAEECVSAITVIFSDRSAVETVGYLSGDDAQAFVDVIDEVSLRSFVSEERARLPLPKPPHFR